MRVGANLSVGGGWLGVAWPGRRNRAGAFGLPSSDGCSRSPFAKPELAERPDAAMPGEAMAPTVPAVLALPGGGVKVDGDNGGVGVCAAVGSGATMIPAASTSAAKPGARRRGRNDDRLDANARNCAATVRFTSEVAKANHRAGA